jgi:hypothetical protein
MKVERKNITQPADWWAAFRKAASKRHMTLSEWMGAVCKSSLPESQQVELSERPPANRPKQN